MTRDGEDEGGEAGERSREAARPDDGGRVPLPSPEEAPELLGERSDYPVPFGDDSAGLPRTSKARGGGDAATSESTERPRK